MALSYWTTQSGGHVIACCLQHAEHQAHGLDDSLASPEPADEANPEYGDSCYCEDEEGPVYNSGCADYDLARMTAGLRR